MTSPATDHPLYRNEHGLWCPCCGNHIAASWTMEEEDYEPPMICKQCGFPDEIDPEAI